MNQYRIGNDVIDIEWKIFRKNGLPENFDDPAIDIENIILEIRNLSCGIRDKQTFTHSGNSIRLSYMANEQKQVGIYDLFLQYKIADETVEGGFRTYSLDHSGAFELVSKSADVVIPEDRLVYEGIVEQLQGLSAYEVYLKNTTDNPPLTETEWLEDLKLHFDELTVDEIAILQQPALLAANAALSAANEANLAADNASAAADLANSKALLAEEAADRANSVNKIFIDTAENPRNGDELIKDGIRYMMLASEWIQL
jgi:hypothetical protein